ncbi:CRISPR-associated ring nuclease Csm6 [Thiothrix eikelboomii]|uniref:CRISPR-associated protein, NE0113 family n=2 Tax=Thiothrix eikelboomii TaxID=92487 RepID=A0A1T4XBA9_9GAMM|nr:CRISPR-associated protein, NE0113 family [Thiothrix eikelboomii]
MTSPTPLQPQTYPRRILLAVAAKSPQIITETIYALAVEEPRWLPTELHVITTGRGAKTIQAALGAEGGNWLAQLCQDYQLPLICLQKNNLHIITNQHNQPLEDVRNSADNACAADFITQFVREFTADPQCSLYASLSGGRRTMTYYMGYAMSLFGRAQDRLTHVLIEDDYFFNDQFYYPPPYPKLIPCKDGTEVDAQTIEITLADLPFIHLRDTLPAEIFSGKQRFTDLIATAQAQIVQPSVKFNRALKQLMCGGKLIKMPPLHMTFYVWMLERCMNQRPAIHWTTQETPKLATQFLKLYANLYSTNGYYEAAEKSLAAGLTKSWFEEKKSKINKALTEQLGHSTALYYHIHSQGKRPLTRFGLTLSATAIHLSDS